MELQNLLSVVIAAMTSLGAMLFAMGSQNPWLAIALWMSAVVSLVITDFLAALRVPRGVASSLMWVLLLVFVPYFLMQPGWDARLQAVAGLLVCLQIMLLFQEKDPRIYGWLAVMSLLQVVVAARYSQGPAFGGLLVFYAIVGIFALSLLVLYSQWARFDGASRAKHSSSMPPGEENALRVLDAIGRAAALVVPPLGGIPPEGGTTSGRSATLASRTGRAENTRRAPLAGEAAGGQRPTTARWPLVAAKSGFSSSSAGSGRSAVVSELFARLTLVIAGGLFLAGLIFCTVPRVHLSAWRGEERKAISTVGFGDKISLGGLGETIENPQEVMQLKLLDPATRQPYPMAEAVYLRGSMASWYANNNWRRLPPPQETSAGGLRHPRDAGKVTKTRRTAESDSDGDACESDSPFCLGRPVLEQIAMEPYLASGDMFFVWPLIKPFPDSLIYSPSTCRLFRLSNWDLGPRTDNFHCEIFTSGLVDGRQARLLPATGEVDPSPYLQMPSERPLPRVKALADKWRQESGLSRQRPADLADYFQRQLSESGQFQYSLHGEDRDTSIDAVEDFVSSHRRGHCEYFATALAMMLRSQGIPSRVVLGYHCDEWHEDQKYYQVRQLHAHAWVEAFLDPQQIPQEMRRGQPVRWMYGGWLRLDPTPAGETGSEAARRTLWGAWQGRWHAVERYWGKYIVDMDRKRQRESVYEPISRATRSLSGKLFNPRWWRDLLAALWHSLAAGQPGGIMGWLLGAGKLIAVLTVLLAAGWWLARGLRRLWQRLAGAGGRRRAGARSSIEFYRRFEQIAARLGLQRRAGQTPREFAWEFASAAAARLAVAGSHSDLRDRALLVADAFYRVRFGRQALDAQSAETVEQALRELTAGAEETRTKP